MTARQTRGDERKSRRFRFPEDSLPSVRVVRDTTTWSAQLGDLSEDGALVRIQGEAPAVRTTVDLVLSDFEALGIAPLHGMEVRKMLRDVTVHAQELSHAHDDAPAEADERHEKKGKKKKDKKDRDA